MRILFTRKVFEAEKTSLQASPQSFFSVASFHWPLLYVCPQGVLVPQGGQAEWVKSCRAASGVLWQQRRTSGWPGPRSAVLRPLVVSNSLLLHGLQPARLLGPWAFPGKNTGVVVISSSRKSSQPRDRNCIFCIAGEFFSTEPPRKPSGPRGVTYRDDGSSGQTELCTLIGWSREAWEVSKSELLLPPQYR